jgi:hypothetical protein
MKFYNVQNVNKSNHATMSFFEKEIHIPGYLLSAKPPAEMKICRRDFLSVNRDSGLTKVRIPANLPAANMYLSVTPRYCSYFYIIHLLLILLMLI